MYQLSPIMKYKNDLCNMTVLIFFIADKEIIYLDLSCFFILSQVNSSALVWKVELSSPFNRFRLLTNKGNVTQLVELKGGTLVECYHHIN